MEDNRQIMELDSEIISSLVLAGDLSKLSSTQKVKYYSLMCNRLGIDPTTQPFKLMRLQGKEVMYCDRSGTAQLNKIHRISHTKIKTETMADIYIVHVRAVGPDGRSTESCGAVNIKGLSGDSLANAIMKAETKAKRRSTLDLVGLGMLDETEIEDITPLKETPKILETKPIIADPAPGTIAQEVDLAAKAEEAKARKAQLEAEAAAKAPKNPVEAPKQEHQGLPPIPAQETLKGLIAAYYPPTGKGPHKFYIEGQYCQTFDEDKATTLKNHKTKEEEVEVVVHHVTSTNKKTGQVYDNLEIDEIAVITPPVENANDW